MGESGENKSVERERDSRGEKDALLTSVIKFHAEKPFTRLAQRLVSLVFGAAVLLPFVEEVVASAAATVVAQLRNSPRKRLMEKND